MSHAVCGVCPHHCRIAEGVLGRCRARGNVGGDVVCVSYGKATALALDPIEKKPLARFFPGSMILSYGSFGCSMSCPFCQNHGIAQTGETEAGELREITPEELCSLALRLRGRGNIGAAFTYNEPLTGYEFVRDASIKIREAGMKTVLVTNGMAELPVLEEILPHIDAMNIDLKGFRPEIYRSFGGDLDTVLRFIGRAAESAHVEITSLIVPGFNDGAEDMEREAAWIAGISPEIPLHVTRYFPRYKMTAPATRREVLYTLCETAEKYLRYVFPGNI